jgi:hypothetical protein
MIQLSNDCLVFQLSDGQAIPCSVERFTLELVGENAGLIDPDVIRNAAQGVLHYFREELGRTWVTLGEFTEALERVLRSFGLNVIASPAVPGETPSDAVPMESAADKQLQGADLGRLTSTGGDTCELIFFNRLRSTVREQLDTNTGCVCFKGLRRCAKRLVGAQRWCRRSARMSDQIVSFLRDCLNAEAAGRDCALVVI